MIAAKAVVGGLLRTTLATLLPALCHPLGGEILLAQINSVCQQSRGRIATPQQGDARLL